MPIVIGVRGLREFQRDLRRLGPEASKQLRVKLNRVADLVVADARGSFREVLTGRARNSIRATSTQREARISAGGARVAYYAWLDFGGRIPVGHHRGGGGRRAFYSDGRYIFRSFYELQDNGTLQRELVAALLDAGRAVGVDVTGG